MSSNTKPATGTVRLGLILTAVILLALIPPLTLLGVAIWRASAADRASASAQFLSQARTMSNMFASALQANIAVVSAVADAEGVAGGTLDRLHGISSFFAADIVDPSTNPAFPAVPAEAHGWAASNLFDIEPGEQARLAITLNAEGDPLTLVMDPRQLTRGLRIETRPDDDTLVAIVDGNGHIIARSRDEDRFIGARVPTWDALLAVGAPTGIFSAQLLDGDSITFAFSTIANTPGWVVVVGVPTAIFDARSREPWLFAIGGGVAAIIAGAGLALVIARRIVRPLGDLAAYAETTISGEPNTPPGRSLIAEYETLRHTLIDTQQRLVDRANSLAISEARFRAVARAGAVVTWRGSIDGNLLELDGWDDLSGLPGEPLLGHAWADSIHPDDRHYMRRLWHDCLRACAPLDAECRVATAEGEWLYVRIRGVCLLDSTGAPVEWAGTIEDIHTRKLREQRDYHLAFHDQLTGLPNRGLLKERLDDVMDATRQRGPGALLYVDLDHFKQANDSYGHATGDAILRIFSERLCSQLRASDMAARMGGDEFAVILSEIESPNDALFTAMRIIRSVSAPYDVDGTAIRIGAPIGITMIDGLQPAEILLRQADLALYEAKGAGRGHAIIYDPQLGRRFA
ncbi:MAG: diguanylate cyclase [Hyphomicrobiales bacterium]|nr:MAG: diguanylate cyclase [Hyphomicrobiales bacterium]